MTLWGACIAGATYVRPTALPMMPVFLVIQWALDRNWQKFIWGGFLAAVAASLLFAPWSYRSIVLFDRFVLVAANGGVNLWMGNNPDSTGGYMELPSKRFANEVDRDRYYGHEAVHFILSNPLTYFELSIKRVATTYGRETIGVAWNEKGLSSKFGKTFLVALKTISSAYWWIMLILGSVGIVLIVRRGLAVQIWPLLAGFGYFALFPVFTVAMDRYHVPIDPLLAIFAAFALLNRNSMPEPQNSEPQKRAQDAEQQRA
jgi:hypothetical protein